MAIYRGTYYSASSCTGSARPGAKALMSWYLGAYGSRGAANLGIYVCKRLGSGFSIHGHGRACDMGTKPYNNPGAGWPSWGWSLADKLRLNSAELGIQLIIFRGKVWSCRYPDKGWRAYDGSDPHNGHMHVELIPDTAASLTVDRIERVIGGTSSTPSLPSTGLVPAPPLRENDTGPRVGHLQRALNQALGLTLAVDEDYGPATTTAVRALQRRARITEDGKYGDDSEAALKRLLEDDMPTAKEVALEVWRYKNPSLSARDAFAFLRDTAAVLTELKAGRLREEAILAAVKGLNTQSVIAAVNAAAAADAERDAALLAEAAATVRAALDPAVLAAEIAEGLDQELDLETAERAVETALRRVFGELDGTTEAGA